VNRPSPSVILMLLACGLPLGPATALVARAAVTEADLARLAAAQPGDVTSSTSAYIIPDMVDVQSYVPGAMGISMGELLRVSVFNVCNVPVRQVEVSSAIKFDANGMVILSRDLNQLRQRAFPAETAVIGTYHLQRNKLTVVVRRVSLENSLISAIATREARWRCSSPGFGSPSFSTSIH